MKNEGETLFLLLLFFGGVFLFLLCVCVFVGVALSIAQCDIQE